MKDFFRHHKFSKNCLALIVGMKVRSKSGTYNGGTALIVVALIVREECITIHNENLTHMLKICTMIEVPRIT